MKIAVVQINPEKGDIHSNIAQHIKYIQAATENEVGLVCFPELSITGYEPGLADELSTNPNDTRFEVFQQLSDQNNMIIGIGAPIVAEKGNQIGMIIFQPYQQRICYSKQLLHTDELPFFVNGHYQAIIEREEYKIAPAICYESLQDEHADRSNKLGANIYLASVAKSQRGVDAAKVHYPKIAQKFRMPVLMSNCVGPADDFIGAGHTAVWSKDGVLLESFNDKATGLIIFDADNDATVKIEF
ncbi:MAG: carbon-nitrogen hydrolase family protein [Chitinophaga sp.]|uniref:carbon-nitrogen hydrolase family protein n=1 Tax=Chitinophaga sp. TaxID=1869181 RepID=UPI001B0A29D7|nr:carbon-nitrogen hydrolase family protein [Chitinophaga sp.]MBO9731503.1 carbon-nitrogen hydrolase family protein [Chitinophaga sp.]